MLGIEDTKRKPTRQQIAYSSKVIKLSRFVLFKLKCVGICCLFACLSDWWICLGSLHEETCYEKYAWLSPWSKALVHTFSPVLLNVLHKATFLKYLQRQYLIH